MEETLPFQESVELGIVRVFFILRVVSSSTVRVSMDQTSARIFV